MCQKNHETEEFMKNKVFSYGVLTALLCVMVVSVNVVVLAQHGHQRHDMQTQPAGAFSANMEKPFPVLMDDAMTVMDRDMKVAPMTGDPDHDFAAMMIPHHQGAIDMAKVELLYGKDPALRRLAQEIIVTQEQEIVVMRMRLEQLKIQ
jgi:uncharacterized protein (DUF305 family)